MSSFSKADYLRLCEQILKDQYGDDEPDEYGVENQAWIPSEPSSDLKKKISLPSNNGVIDLTSGKKDKIIDSMYKCSNLKVGNFIIKVTAYHGEPDTYNNKTYISINISIYENKQQTHLGRTSNMLSKINPNKDNRFENRPWLVYFKSFDKGINIPVEEFPDIVRWLQAIGKMSAFI